MTKEEKELLVKDLSSRIPYGVKVKVNGRPKILRGVVGDEIVVRGRLEDKWIDSYYDIQEWDIKPYLIPMSSMTEDMKSIYLTLRAHAGAFTCVEWLDRNHFDDRTNMDGEHLIQSHLALKAKEGMYNNKKK
jgi:hypothetical protein